MLILGVKPSLQENSAQMSTSEPDQTNPEHMILVVELHLPIPATASNHTSGL